MSNFIPTNQFAATSRAVLKIVWGIEAQHITIHDAVGEYHTETIAILGSLGMLGRANDSAKPISSATLTEVVIVERANEALKALLDFTTRTIH